ncbi:MAG: dihydroneopterin aldolase [Paramuribaculum sp.]|nr:dihydroneopterin aldolase [Paramuribaculum sp.]
MTGTIEIDSLRLFARHGVAGQERIVGNIFEVSLSILYPLDYATGSDNLQDTLNYAEVINIVRAEMEIPSQLLEHVAGRIIKRLTSEFPQIYGGKIKITKTVPPCGVEIKGVSVILEW